ncbi:hypothetical protein L2E82_12979 [Cichorium intybus]|uniref:Uncharacterized protein n=1 Tax=Cichorium intybus TaxID=13427 RepID=A0ACB9GIK3_CICIN|nr:hypothetical protein L2E82_12979 [Cichorium intybus]
MVLAEMNDIKDDIKSWLGVALNNQDTCLEGFKGPNSKNKTTVSRQRFLISFASLSLSPLSGFIRLTRFLSPYMSLLCA